MSELHHYLMLHVGDTLMEMAPLTNEQRGIYFTLICHYWKSGSIPGDDRVLARLAGVSLIKWNHIGPAIKAFFTASNCQEGQASNCQEGNGKSSHSSLDGNFKLLHSKLDAQRTRALAVSEARKAAGNKGLEKRYGQQLPQQKPSNELASAIAKPLPPISKEVSLSPIERERDTSCALPERDERFEGARALAARPISETPQPPFEVQGSDDYLRNLLGAIAPNDTTQAEPTPEQPTKQQQMAELHEQLVKSITGYAARPQDPVRSVEEQLAALREPTNAFRPPKPPNGSGDTH